MRSRPSSIARLFGRWFVLGTLFLAEGGALQAQANETVSKIVAAWERRRARLVLVRYELTGERTWFRGCLNDPTVPAAELPGGPGDNPAEDITEKLTRTVLLDFAGNRHRIEWDHPEYSTAERRIYRVRCLSVCDGIELRSRIFENSGPPIRSNRAGRHVDLIIQRGELPASVLDIRYLPLFLGHGIVFHEFSRPRPGALTPPLRSEQLTYIGDRDYGGRSCAVLQTPHGRIGPYEIWVDVPLDAAVVRMTGRPPDPLWTLDIRYRETEDGWLTEGWTNTQKRIFGDGPGQTQTVLVTAIEPRPPISDADFRVETVPGMYVQEITRSKNPRTGDVHSQSEYYRTEPDGRKTVLDETLYPLSQ